MQYGKNKLQEGKRPSIAARFFSQFADFMILILIVSAVISFVISLLEHETDYADPIIIFAIVLMNALIGTIQESKAERSLEALKELSAPAASVLRDQKRITIPSSQLVPGDIVYLESGAFVPADLRLLSAVELKTDESSLTGETGAVKKDADAVLPVKTPPADQKNMVFSSTTILSGRGLGVVAATGMNSQVGTIASLLLTPQNESTPLQKRLEKLGKVLGCTALLICGVIFLLGIMEGRPVFEMFMTSVSLSVATIPEGLPVVVTIMLSLGVQKMAKEHTIVRKLPAVETLGSASVICSDKTGTLTQNKMTAVAFYSVNREEAVNQPFTKALLTRAALCCDSTETLDGDELVIQGEPTENAIIKAASLMSLHKSQLDIANPRVAEIPFDSGRKKMSVIVKKAHSMEQITKGAFDYLLPICTHVSADGKIVPMSKSYKERLIAANAKMTEHALRVLAVAYRENVSKKPIEKDLVFLGMIGMMDPPRPEVPGAVRLCKQAGIVPVMITGDHINTAKAIASQIGILEKGCLAITGAELSEMDDQSLMDHLKEYRVFARVTPEHKLRIINAYKNTGETVAMTGDGVNDAPALKAADIGCAMGITGTDVAKGAADMVLTDDNFATIVSAVREGRCIFDNIQKAVHFLLSSNIGELITILIAILFRLSTPLLAIHLLWINLITDSLPAICLGLEKPEKNIMGRAPLKKDSSIFTRSLVVQILLEGMMIGALALLAFVIGYRFFGGEQLILGRTMCFCVLSLSQLFHAFNVKSSDSLLVSGVTGNLPLVFSFIFLTALQTGVVMLEPLRALFKVTSLTIFQWTIVFIMSACPLFIVELQKNAERKALSK